MINRERLVKRIIKRKIAYYNKLQHDYVKMFAERFKDFPPFIVAKQQKHDVADNFISLHAPWSKAPSEYDIIQLKERE